MNYVNKNFRFTNEEWSLFLRVQSIFSADLGTKVKEKQAVVIAMKRILDYSSADLQTSNDIDEIDEINPQFDEIIEDSINFLDLFSISEQMLEPYRKSKKKIPFPLIRIRKGFVLRSLTGSDLERNPSPGDSCTITMINGMSATVEVISVTSQRIEFLRTSDNKHYYLLVHNVYNIDFNDDDEQIFY